MPLPMPSRICLRPCHGLGPCIAPCAGPWGRPQRRQGGLRGLAHGRQMRIGIGIGRKGSVAAQPKKGSIARAIWLAYNTLLNITPMYMYNNTSNNHNNTFTHTYIYMNVYTYCIPFCVLPSWAEQLLIPSSFLFSDLAQQWVGISTWGLWWCWQYKTYKD